MDMIILYTFERPAMPQSQVVTARVPEDLALELDKAAQYLDRSKAWIVNQALSQWVRDMQRDIETYEALVAMENGEVISHEDAIDYLEHLGTDNPKPFPKTKNGH